MILIGITVCGTIGSCIGNLFDGQSFFNFLAFGIWAIILSTVGSFVGIWVGYKAGQYMGL
jgi:hypothetical protein